MSAGDQQHQEGEGDGAEHPDGQGVGLHVVDRDERRVVAPDERPAEVQADSQAQSQTGLHGGGHGRQQARGHATSVQRLLNHALNVFFVELLRHWRDDAAGPAGTDRKQTGNRQETNVSSGLNETSGSPYRLQEVQTISLPPPCYDLTEACRV